MRRTEFRALGGSRVYKGAIWGKQIGNPGLIATLARLMGPGGLRSVVAESVLVKQQLLILNRTRHRAPNLCASDRILAGVCALFMRPARVIRSAIVLRPSTILEFHRALRTRKYRWLFAPTRRRTGPQGPSNGHCQTN